MEQLDKLNSPIKIEEITKVISQSIKRKAPDGFTNAFFLKSYRMT